MRKILILATLLILSSFCGLSQSQSFRVADTSFLLNDKPYVIRCGEMHFARIPKPYWKHRLQMAKAMGLNTVCAYLFWNFIEKEEGRFDWSDQANAAEFCKLAQQEGLYVILRPGPYSCAEWEFGGFPWWLLKDKTMRVRTQHPAYLAACKKYLLDVGKQLAPLQITNGGNIIMVQVENEYGSFGNDKAYIGIIRDNLKEAGFTVPLFTCDGPVQLKNDVRDDIFAAVNFGSDPESGFKALREVQTYGPLMCSEYYPGWFDSWGRPHHTGTTDRVVKELKYMLDHNASFSIYMAHGGTTFGTYSGANAPPFLPQTSSYDYNAPIDESGNPTPKYFALRTLFSQYLQQGEYLPNLPEPKKAQSLNQFNFNSVAPLHKNLPEAFLSDTLMLMEDFNQGYGAMLYTTSLMPGNKATIRFKDIHDYAIVYLDGKQLATMDRRKENFTVKIPERTKASNLEILVEATGRVNYGKLMHDRKGIHGPVIFNDGNIETELKKWKHYAIPLGENNLQATYQPLSQINDVSASFYKATFVVTDTTNDTYLDMRTWQKGLVWVNGICLGRYWNIGPTQTMFLPGCWLKKGINEVVVFDLFGITNPKLQALDNPILNDVTEKKEGMHKKSDQHWQPDTNHLHFTGTFENSKSWQTVTFKPLKAQYFCLEALNEFNNQPFTTVAEIMLLDKDGKEIPRGSWKILYADSEELEAEDGNAVNVFDLQFTSIWHTQWQNNLPVHPHHIVFDLDTEYTIGGMKLLPRQDSSNGRIKDFRLYFSVQKFKNL